MPTLYKKDARQFISIFVKKLDIADYKEVRSNFESYLKRNKLECIITNTNEIIYTYGKMVEQYLNYELSDRLKESVNNIHLSSMRSAHLEIVNGKFINSAFYYEPLKNFKAIGSIIIFYKQDHNEEAYELLTKIK